MRRKKKREWLFKTALKKTQSFSLNVNKIASSNSEAILMHYLAVIIVEIRLVKQLADSEFS
jgi:hypothetical protein